jgi:hypothetical protein
MHLSAQAAYVGVVEDIADDGFFTALSTEKRNERLSISFTTPPLPFGKTKDDVYWGGTGGIASQRIMWAKGPLNAPNNCAANSTFSYHNGHRAVVALSFPGPAAVLCTSPG